jgi:hypothetical protein
VARNRGFSKDPRIRAKQQKTLEVYAEQVPEIGGDPLADKQAMITAVERAGYIRPTTDSAKVRQFMKLWKSDESRAYLCELWGLAVSEDPDPVSLAMQTLHTHVVQTDETWGPRDRSVSLSAAREMVRLFIPAQTTKILSGHLNAKIERPAEFDIEPVMQARTILPEGQEIAKPVGPTGGDNDDEEEDDPDDDD